MPAAASAAPRDLKYELAPPARSLLPAAFCIAPLSGTCSRCLVHTCMNYPCSAKSGHHREPGVATPMAPPPAAFDPRNVSRPPGQSVQQKPDSGCWNPTSFSASTGGIRKCRTTVCQIHAAASASRTRRTPHHGPVACRAFLFQVLLRYGRWQWP